MSASTSPSRHTPIDKALGKLVGKGKIEIADAEAAMKRITPIADYAPMKDASLIIEAATEKEEIKQAIFEKAGQMPRADAIMASNTSSIPITRMANYAPDPARFIGLHFFNPVPVMKLIEVIPGLATARRPPTARPPLPRAWARKWSCRRTNPASSSTASCCR